MEVVTDLQQTCDTLLCQETILLAEDFCLLEGISNSFNFLFVPSNAPNNEEGEGRPSDGMVVFIKNTLKYFLVFHTNINIIVFMK